MSWRGETPLSITASNITAPTQFADAKGIKYAYRRFGKAGVMPLLCLQHFTGNLDNWDSAVTDPLAAERDLILFESSGIGRSDGTVPNTVGVMADHALTFLDALNIKTCDVLGYSLGGMVAQDMVRSRPRVFRKMILVGTAPRGGEDVMHLDKPSISKWTEDKSLHGYQVLQKIFFDQTESSQAAGGAFIERLVLRKEDRDKPSGPEVAQAQMAAFRDWEKPNGERFSDLRGIQQPVLVINGKHDEMIPVRNSYWLSENLPNAVLLTYPDSGHGSLFQWHDSFTRNANAFFALDSESAPY
jgi:pimeloyl-ACP methyl ester carboxylesterase